MKDSVKYRNWLSRLKSEGINVRSVEELQTIRSPRGNVLFSMIKTDAVDSDGVPLLPVVVLRGHFVSVMTHLVDTATDEKFMLLVKQRRVATGGWFYEHPAGMCDEDSDPLAVAVKEVKEETGLEMERADIVALNERPFYSSPGLLDEGGYFFYCRVETDRAVIDQFRGKATGAADESEFIHTVVLPDNQALPLIESGPSLLNYYLYKSKFPD
jgi:8-oxo-dGTP pyrophosphatase MutT (NUDIX family)